MDVGGDIQATGAAANGAPLLTLDQLLDDDAPFLEAEGVVGSDKSLDTDDNGGDSSDLSGLSDGDSYYVVVIDATTIKLARCQALWRRYRPSNAKWYT